MDEIQCVIEAINGCKHVLVTTHVRPDGDALGSTCALVLGMRQKGIEAQVLLLSHLPTKYAFIYQENQVKHWDAEGGWPAELGLERFDALLVVDTGTWSQLPGLKERIGQIKGPKVVVDHHLTQEEWADVKLVRTKAAAAGEIAAELLDRWGVKLDQPMATALFLALVSDTGWFQYSNTTPGTMRLAAKLMEAGVDTDRIYQKLYQNERPQRIALQTRAMDSMKLAGGGALAVMRIFRKDFAETSAGVPDTEGLVNIPLQIGNVMVSMLGVEPGDFGPVRVSLRSKGQVDLAKFCEKFGGGGHARAAGLKLEGGLDEVMAKVVLEMEKVLQDVEK
ncbi:MAG: DHH family phosphoesterase [Phycisphaerales bacterium]|jgi:phosphoesterase RecJ-like protein|nr:DHH family phosphoesterase [Phycisphaerales bacterium]